MRPPNSLILVRDAESYEIPSWSGAGIVKATESCIAVGTVAEPDGTTSVWFGQEDESLPIEAFKGELRVPSGRMIVSTVSEETLLARNVPSQRVSLRVLVNDASEPNEIAIVIDSDS